MKIIKNLFKNKKDKKKSTDKQQTQTTPQSFFMVPSTEENFYKQHPELKPTQENKNTIKNMLKDLKDKTTQQYNNKSINSVGMTDYMFYNKFEPNWYNQLQNSYNCYCENSENERNAVFWNLFKNNYYYQCYTAIFPQLFQILYDTNIFFKTTLETPISYAVDGLLFNINENNIQELDKLELKEKNNKINSYIQDIKNAIIHTELVGGSIVCYDENRKSFVFYDKTKLSREQCLDLIDKKISSVIIDNKKYKSENVFLLCSCNKQENKYTYDVAPFGLSWYESKIEYIQALIYAIQDLFEILDTTIFKDCTIETSKNSSSGVPINKINPIALEVLERTKQVGRWIMKNLNVRNGVFHKDDIDYKVYSSNIDFDKYINGLLFYMTFLSEGIPATIFKGGIDGSFTIGSSSDESATSLLNKTINKIRTNYNSYFYWITNKMKKIIDIENEDNLTIDFDFVENGAFKQKQTAESLKLVSELLSSISNTNGDLSKIQDISNELLDKTRIILEK